jgi:hypothetical protein
VKSKTVWLPSRESGLVDGGLIFNVVEAIVSECNAVVIAVEIVLLGPDSFGKTTTAKFLRAYFGNCVH